MTAWFVAFLTSSDLAEAVVVGIASSIAGVLAERLLLDKRKPPESSE